MKAINSEIKSDCFIGSSVLISVVIPVFNRSDLLVSTLDSIRSQTYRPIEIVVIDDGSTDNTSDVIHTWTTHNNEKEGTLTVRFVRQVNQGANAARNRGIQEARGEYIAFLDSDDRWLPEKLVKQIGEFEKDNRIGGVYCGIVNVDLSTGIKETPTPKTYPEGDLLRQILIHDVTEPTSCWMVRKACFQEAGLFDTSLPARQDWDMWIRLAEKYNIGCVPEILVEMGNHPGERVRSKADREIAAHKVIFQKYAYLRKRFSYWVSLAARSAMYRRRGRVYFHRDVSRKKALLMLLSAIVVWPFCFDSYAALAGMMLPKGFRRKIHVAWNRIFGKTKLAIKTH